MGRIVDRRDNGPGDRCRVGARRGWGRGTLIGGVIAVLAACTSAPPVDPAPAPGPPTAGPMVRILQLNLCSSGIAACFTGRAAEEAAAVVRAELPDLITLNEACRDDLGPLVEALGEAQPDAAVSSGFQAARDARTGAPYLCRNGEEYGNGIVARWPAPPADGGIHPTQDPADPEQRSWLCLNPDDAPVSVCTSHLAYTIRDVAVAQCDYLIGTVVEQQRAREGDLPVVLAGDFNLGAGSAELAGCLPPGAPRVDDGRAQLVVATPELVATDVRLLDLRGATDHPGLLVTLARAA